MSSIKDLKAYRLVKEEELLEVNGKGYLLEHIKTKARVLVVSNDDKNKVFHIGFRTPPKDSTGTPHIIEHTVLCGSKKFPVKDPFVELCKGSLNTFLNAMTYSDKTVYPVASFNDKDFKNLVDVYLDAVFHPNIYDKEEIFQQEGWHYELADKDAELIINGVVYNEMKGVYSSPDQVLYRAIEKALLPDTCYAKDSGGFPSVIPELTREDYLDFHRKYYHPSNSYIYLYGDLDMAEELEFIDKEYLSEYDYLYVPSEIEEQELFKAPVDYREEYSLSEAEELADNTFLAYSTIIGKSTDKKLTTAMEVLEYVLLDSPGAPLKKALIDAEIGADIESMYDPGVYQPTFAIIAHNANEEDKEKFIGIIEDTLKDIIKNGVNKKSLRAAINYFEFKHKEGNFGRYPKGLMLGLDAMETWLYDDMSALSLFTMNDVYTELKVEVDTDYYERVIEEYILNNTHKVNIVIAPKHGLDEEKAEKLKAELAAYKASLSAEEIDEIVAKTAHLKQYQSEPSSQEDLEKIPLLAISDIDKEARKFKNNVTEIENVKVVSQPIFTNGISYIELFFKLDDIELEDIRPLTLLTEIFKYVDTDSHTMSDLTDELNLTVGGVGFNVGVCTVKNDKPELATKLSKKQYKPLPYFSIKLKTLDENLDAGMKLMEEILFTSHITDKKRLKEIIAEIKSSTKQDLVSAGHTTTAQRASSYIDETSVYKEYIGGMDFYKYIEDLDKNFEDRYEALADSLTTVLSQVLRRGSLVVDYISDKNPEEMLKNSITEFSRKLSSRPPYEGLKPIDTIKKNEAFKTSTQVQYVATAGNFLDTGLEYDGSLNVLQVIFAYEYLWLNVRVKGGAYGCMCNFTRTGMGYLTSYRDPNLMETYDIYKNAWEYVRDFDCEDRDMVKYIIGAISKSDGPLSPSAEGSFSFMAYISGITQEELQKSRDEVLSTNQEKIRSLYNHVKAITDTDTICVIGGDAKIKEAKDIAENKYKGLVINEQFI